jgi:DNA polymerase/3'-5' exonuclease PolX
MSTSTDYKAMILAELEVLRSLATTETAGTFKVRAYATALKTLSALPHIKSPADLPPSTKGDGLGKEIRTKIEKICIDGRLDISEDARQSAAALNIFQGIYGVGPKKAIDLIAAGYRTLAEVRAAATANPKLLNRNQHVGLRYYEDINSRIPRGEMDAHAALLMAAFCDTGAVGHRGPAALEGVIVGSYRRGTSNSGDIDMLIRTANPSDDAGAALGAYVNALKAQGYIREVLAQGEHKCLAVAALPGGLARRLDLLVTPPEEFPFAVLYFTGSDGFNVAMRTHALTRGFTLNEHALTQVSTGVAVRGIKSERDIFGCLRLTYREPTERTGPEACAMLPGST